MGLKNALEVLYSYTKGVSDYRETESYILSGTTVATQPNSAILIIFHTNEIQKYINI